ncbi:MAG TPA: hypothetical protein VJR91_14345 [Burkholderia sp.]|nr:hypothetical protein [Burkholderia sp.]
MSGFDLLAAPGNLAKPHRPEINGRSGKNFRIFPPQLIIAIFSMTD